MSLLASPGGEPPGQKSEALRAKIQPRSNVLSSSKGNALPVPSAVEGSPPKGGFALSARGFIPAQPEKLVPLGLHTPLILQFAFSDDIIALSFWGTSS